MLFTLEDLADVVEGISLPELKTCVQALKTAQAKEDREKYYLRLDVLISIVREIADDDWLWETVGRVSLTYATLRLIVDRIFDIETEKDVKELLV